MSLYVILDRDFLSRKKILETARRVLKGGVSLLQLRDKDSSAPDAIKTAKALKSLAKRYEVPLIINDRLDVAMAVDADGLHLGRGDLSAGLARRFIGKKKLLGVSVKNMREAKKAKKEGASYLGIGPIFKTPIKPKEKAKGPFVLGRIKRIKIPFFAIGGINHKNICYLVDKGFKDVAVIRAVCNAADPYVAVKTLKESLV